MRTSLGPHAGPARAHSEGETILRIDIQKHQCLSIEENKLRLPHINLCNGAVVTRHELLYPSSGYPHRSPHRSLGIPRNFLGMFGIFLVYGPIWALMGPYGPLWALMGPYEPLWVLLDRSWQVRTCPISDFW